MQRVLLHICCGICASSVVLRLREEGFEPTGFFYNPNIHPQEEYFKRIEVARQAASLLGFDLILGIYDKDNWLEKTVQFKKEPEGGERCALCFKIRLERANIKAQELGIDYFTTTLSVSSHKNSKLINEIACALNPAAFLKRDFKKHDGFKLAMGFSRRYNLYRQNYCGCIYSRNSKI